ncbi:hypothetical protein E2C01_084539 [Portunus trituberculatus]|uniref:Uncharacterized protein n=1 Tax=Portunus trituberculatus TaxID=210409 RepID=A0A5B7J499_PORTR|nr:hypothetical protein [Portunus trituberculatus]
MRHCNTQWTHVAHTAVTSLTEGWVVCGHGRQHGVVSIHEDSLCVWREWPAVSCCSVNDEKHCSDGSSPQCSRLTHFLRQTGCTFTPSPELWCCADTP